MRSESTSALGQPRLTKPTFGLLRLTVFTLFGGVAGSGLNCTPKTQFPADKLAVRGRSEPCLNSVHTVKYKQQKLRLSANGTLFEILKNPRAVPIKTLNVSPVRPMWVK